MDEGSKKLAYINIVANFLIVAGILFILLAYSQVIYDEVWYKFKSLKKQEYILQAGMVKESAKESVFSKFLSSSPVLIKPVNTSFSIVIEKIDVNAPINADVSVIDSKKYFESLKTGVAHAASSNYPSTEPGNVYLFAHSSINFWQLGKYAKTFNLLRKLANGDKIHVFYEGKDYIYEVVNKETMKGFNTYPLKRAVIESILTLQTCDPPGTTLNRLVVTAKLVEVRPRSDLGPTLGVLE